MKSFIMLSTQGSGYPITFAVFYWLEASHRKSQFLSTLKERRLYKGMIHEGPPEGVSATRTIILTDYIYSDDGT